MSVTIKDVAREAGVSISTVSKVINKSPVISNETVKKVIEVIERLEYAPNKRASNFARAKTSNIVFITTLKKGQAFDNPHMFDIMCGVQNKLEHHNYSLTITNVNDEKNVFDTVKKIIMEKSADGVIIHCGCNKSTLDYISEKNFPHIIGYKPDSKHSRICWLDINNNLSGEIAARHLFGCGYRRIAFIGGSLKINVVANRFHGAQLFLNNNNLEIKDEHRLSINYNIDESYRAMVSLLNMENRPDSVICEYSLIAVGVSKALNIHKINVPDEMGLIMIDDNPYYKVISPAPTVVNIDVYDMGIQSAEALIRKINNPELLIQMYSTLPQLIVRETTKF